MIDFSFERNPFEVTPDPRMVFRHPQFSDALDALERGLYDGKGFLVFTGEVGAGKTTLLRTFLAAPHPNLETAVILNSGLAADELLLAIVEDLGLKCGAGYSRKALLDLLQGHLLEAFAAGRRTAVFIDEAQHLDFESLELVRMLSNLETDTDKLIQVVLFGQDPLRETLARPELFQLRSRVAVHRHLRPLSEVDTAAYVLHRLATARPRMPVTFSPAGLRRLHAHARGLPRLVNILADGALRIASAADGMIVDEQHIDAARAEFADLDPDSGGRPGLAGASLPEASPRTATPAAVPATVSPVAASTISPAAAAYAPPREVARIPLPSEKWPATTVFAWALLVVILIVFAVRTWQANRPTSPAPTPSALDPVAVSPLAPTDTPQFFAESEPAENSTWDPAVVAAFLASSGLRTAFEPQPEDLRDPVRFAETLGRTLVAMPADTAALQAIGLPALVRLSPTPEASALIRPLSGQAGVEVHDAHGVQTIPWSALTLESRGTALIAAPQGLDVNIGSDRGSLQKLQNALFAAGHYAGAITGELDPATSEAVLDFQRVQGLPQTGLADPTTVLALFRLGVWKP